MIKAIITFIAGVFAGMYGGQKNKSVRRFGIPVISTIFAFSIRPRMRYTAFLLFCPVLIMGYGEHSVLYGILGNNDGLVRLVYALLLSIPFYFFNLRRGLLAGLLLIIAFQVHAESLATIGTFDILIEDIVRYSTLMVLVILNVLTDKD